MTYDNFTIKAQECILKAQQIAAGYEQQTVDTPHLIKGILETDEHVSNYLLGKMNVNIPKLKNELTRVCRNYPRVSGTDKQYLTNDANKSLSSAKKFLKEFGDEYISVELMILGILAGEGKREPICLKLLGATEAGTKSSH